MLFKYGWKDNTNIFLVSLNLRLPDFLTSLEIWITYQIFFLKSVYTTHFLSIFYSYFNNIYLQQRYSMRFRFYSFLRDSKQQPKKVSYAWITHLLRSSDLPEPELLASLWKASFVVCTKYKKDRGVLKFEIDRQLAGFKGKVSKVAVETMWT